MKKIYYTFLSLLLCIITLGNANAAPAKDYYSSAEGKNQKELITALYKIVGPHTAVSYSGLWSVYYDSDRRANGKIWDMYSTKDYTYKKDQCGTYSNIGDCYNREHSFPKSWFSDASPMVSDAYHIYPTDGKVNGQRSNYPYGECANGTTLSPNGSVKALGKLGTSTFAGYSGVVFEPDDQYKGDFARSYFYMATAYNDKIAHWNSPMLSGNNYPCYSTWAINLLLKWSREDPVSEKEISRNEAVSKYQKNRNPFIDYPELAEYIWGNMKDKRWTPGGVQNPTIATPTEGQIVNMGITSLNAPISTSVRIKGSNLTQNLTISISNNAFTTTSTSLSKEDVMNGHDLVFTYKSDVAANSSATVTLSSNEISVSFILKATAYDGIPALDATNITPTSFTANWLKVGNAPTYELKLYGSDGTSLISSYEVTADAEQYDIFNLNESTDYYYSLTDGTLSSNKVKVRTADPVQILTLIYKEGALNMSTTPAKASEPVEVEVYTENINEQITATVSGEFELSFDKSNWSNTLQVSPDGETMYVRSKAISAEGNYTGTLSIESEHNPGEDVDVSVVVAAPRTFLEDFENIEEGGYWTSDVQGTACKWAFKGVGCWADANREGNISARFGKSESSITMQEDKLNGMGTVTFLAAKWGNDATPEVTLSYKLGDNWVAAKTWKITENTMNSFSCPLNLQGASRIKIEKTTGGRFNIDNIGISDFTSSANSITTNDWNIYSVNGGIAVEAEEGANVIIYTTDATQVYSGTINASKKFIPMEQGIYIVTLDNNRGRKVVVK